MSLIRTGHKPSDWRDEGPSTGRISATRYGIRGGAGNPIVVGSLVTGLRPKSGAKAQAEYKAREAKSSLISAWSNPDSGAVEASITEVQT